MKLSNRQLALGKACPFYLAHATPAERRSEVVLTFRKPVPSSMPPAHAPTGQPVILRTQPDEGAALFLM